MEPSAFNDRSDFKPGSDFNNQNNQSKSFAGST